MNLRARKPGSQVVHYTHSGSLIDKALLMLEPLGEISYEEFTRRIMAMADTKTQGQGLANELKTRGFIEKRIRLTEIALTRKRPEA